MDDWPDHDYDISKPPLADRYENNIVPILMAAFFAAAILVALVMALTK